MDSDRVPEPDHCIMRIAFCTPFKPLDHPRPSGDVMIARSIHEYLQRQGHELLTPPHFETTWCFWRPSRWYQLARAMAATRDFLRRKRPDLWLTYHTYDKAPDILGPWLAAPHTAYAIFSGAYAPSRGRRLRYRPGFLLNRKALRTAGHVFVKERWDMEDVAGLLGREGVSYVPPGLFPDDFHRDEAARARLRAEWGLEEDTPLVMSAAVFRPGVKTEGLRQVLLACGRLVREGSPLQVLIAGDGPEREYIEQLAAEQLPGRVRFLGLVPRQELPPFYSAADVFAFPGINEAVGMVLLEAQSCGTPAVAWDHAGGKEVIGHERSGFVTPSFDEQAFTEAIGRLVRDPQLRRRLGRQAQAYVREVHDLNRNYAAMEKRLLQVVEARGGSGS